MILPDLNITTNYDIFKHHQVLFPFKCNVSLKLELPNCIRKSDTSVYFISRCLKNYVGTYYYLPMYFYFI